MRKDDSLFFGYITIDELMKVNTKDTNRCGELTREEALKKGFKDCDWNAYQTRANRIRKSIIEDGYHSDSVIRVAKCKDDGKWYIIDGQGRRMALKMIIDERGKIIKEVPCLVYNSELSSSEIDQRIKDVNTLNTNWSGDNHLRALAYKEGGEIWNAFQEIEKYKDSFAKHGLAVTSYMSKYVFLGERGSHIGSKNITDLKRFETFSDIFSSEYRRFVINASYNGDVQRTSDVKKKIRHTEFGIGIMQVFRAISDTAVKETESVTLARPIIEKEISDFVNKMLEKCDTMNDKTLLRHINQSANVGKKYDKDAILVNFLGMNKGNRFVKKYLTAA